jgi:hypothetical protein
MNPNPVTSVDLKIFLFEFLRKNPNTQVNGILSGARERFGKRLSDDEDRELLELIHELLNSNILMTALNSSNTGWPWLSVTRHGTAVLKDAGPPVYDYEGYLSDLKRKVPNSDPIIVKYLSESLRAFQSNLFYSAMVMLGCASERAILILIDSYIISIQPKVNQDRVRSRTNRRDISTAYKEFKRSFDSTKKQVTITTQVNDFDAHVDAVFNFIRMVRNSIVHPEDLPEVTSALVYSNLQQFAYYLVTIYALIDYYSHNVTKV